MSSSASLRAKVQGLLRANKSETNLASASRLQQIGDLDASIASAMTALDASLSSIPETESVTIQSDGLLVGAASEHNSVAPVCRKDTCSWSTGGAGVDEATCSFESTVTDFDNLTSPGAQAERNPEYQQALQLAQHICTPPTGQVNAPQASAGFCYPIGVSVVTMVHLQQSVPAPTPAISARCPRMVPQPGSVFAGSCNENQLRAKELEAYANQLMTQAMQAKNAVRQIQKEACSSACMHDGMVQDVCASNKAPISLNSTVPAPVVERMPVVATPAEMERTTIMLRNLPNDYTRGMVLSLLDDHGFACCYDFVYVPIDNKRRVGLGYAFVNMLRPADANRAFEALAGFSAWKVPGSIKVLGVAWGNPLQGFDAHVERYRNSPIMHPDVPEDFKPVVFAKGVQMQFPEPTQPLRAPRTR